jgi:NADH:ubiquinone oxidoreductase subunit D
MREQGKGDFLEQTLWKVKEVEEEGDIVAQTLRKVEEEGAFLAQTQRKVREEEGD